MARDLKGEDFLALFRLQSLKIRYNPHVILKDGDAQIALNVIAYQFPDLEHEPWDSDWLLMQLDLDLPIGKWQRQDPCITTFELRELIEWLEEVHENFAVFGTWRSNRLTSRIFFTEPNLGFEVLSPLHFLHRPDTAVYLRVYLGAEFLPPYKEQLVHYPDPKDVREIYLDFRITSAQIHEIISALKSELERLPIRVGLP